MYDQLGIKACKFKEPVEKIISKHLQYSFNFDNIDQKVFADHVKIFKNRCLKQMLLVIVNGIIYLIETDEMQLEFNPFNFLLDVNKVVYSEAYETILAIKLRDLGKFENRDHVVLEVKDRRLLFDFLLEYADQ
mgnify:CR=1 FL=1